MNPLFIGIPLMCLGAGLGAFGGYYFKKASGRFALSFHGIFQKDLVIGCAIYTFGALFGFTALRFGDLSVLYPFAAVGYITSALIGWKVLGEPLNKGKAIAISLIILGLILEVM